MGDRPDLDRGIETYSTTSGPRYRVVVQLVGRTRTTPAVRRSLSFTTKGDARAFRDFARRKGAAEAVRVYDTQPEGQVVVTLAEAVERRLSRSNLDVKPGTVAENRKMVGRSLLPDLGDYPVHALTTARVQQWADERSADVSAKTVHNEHAFLSSVLKDCMRDGLITANPCADVRLPRHAKRRDSLVVPTPDEVGRLMRELDPHWWPFVYTLATTGLRINEGTALMWRHIDLDLATLRVEQGWHKVGGKYILDTPKTIRSRRTLDLDLPTVTVLRQHWDASDEPGPEDLVFRSLHGARLSDTHFRDRYWHEARERAGLRLINPHDLRHGHASTLLAAGIPIEAVSARLGHESRDTTWKLYHHLIPEVRRRYVEATEAAWGALGASVAALTQPQPSALGA